MKRSGIHGSLDENLSFYEKQEGRGKKHEYGRWMSFFLTSCFLLLASIAGSCRLRESGTTVSGTPAATIADTTVTADTTTVEPPPLTYLERKGKRLFLHYCAICHGETGAGDGFNAYNLDPRPRNLTDPQFQDAVSDAWLAEIIAQGGRGVNKSPLMPTWENTLTKKQIEALVAFIRTLPGSVEQ